MPDSATLARLRAARAAMPLARGDDADPQSLIVDTNAAHAAAPQPGFYGGAAPPSRTDEHTGLKPAPPAVPATPACPAPVHLAAVA